MTTEQYSQESIEYEKALKQYYWLCFLSEFSKIIIFLIISIFLHLTKEYLVALVGLMILRSTGGGLHYKHYISCLLVSFLFLYGSIFLAMYLQPHRLLVCISILFCAFAGYFLVPITSVNRPAATQEQIKNSKRKTFFLLFLSFLFACICPQNLFSYIGYWTICLHIFQLFMAHFVEEVKINV